MMSALLSLVLTGCGKGKTPAPAEPSGVLEAIRFTKPALYPEGIDFDAKRSRFLVTSMREGIVGEVSDDGTYKVLIQDPHMVSAVGIRADTERDRLLVCNSDPGVSVHTKKHQQGKLAGLGIFQLSTGKLIQYIDLAKLGGPGGHFCNDIAIDKDGTAYVTDSFSPIIYRVDTGNHASILLQDKRFTGKSFNLNGIVVKDRYLLVVKMNEGLLFKVPLDNPKKYTEVKLKEPIPGGDGLLWGPDGSLIVIANGSLNKTFKLTSSDNWASAQVAGSVDTGNVFATTGVVRQGNIYALYAMLHVLFNPETKQHPESFVIHRQKL